MAVETDYNGFLMSIISDLHSGALLQLHPQKNQCLFAVANWKTNSYFNKAFVNNRPVRNQSTMKTETLPSLPYNSYPLKIVEKNEDKSRLKPVKKEAFKNTFHFYATNTMINDPVNWDANWFGNYE